MLVATLAPWVGNPVLERGGNEKREEKQGTDLFLETGEAKDLKRSQGQFGGTDTR